MESSLSSRDARIIWHPYTQMKKYPFAFGITSAKGAWLYEETGKRFLDGISSWWVNLHGHSHPHITKRLSEQALKLEHCIFAGFTHEPAVELAEKLLSLFRKKYFSRVFYSDNGSTSVEVAIKMAVQYQAKKRRTKNQVVVALEGAYHGDTFGAMAVSGKSLFTKPFEHLLFEVKRLPFPSEKKEALEVFKGIIKTNDVAALIVEPLVQGAAGMRMYSKEALESLFKVAKANEVLIIADEVMTGFGRTGKTFATDYVETTPDIMCLSKGITGGFLPLGVTLSSEKIYTSFLSDDLEDTFFHGHSFTANPISTAASVASIELLLKKETQQSIKMISDEHKKFINSLKEEKGVKHAKALGTIAAIELETQSPTGYQNTFRDKIINFFLSQQILLRPLGNVLYTMPPYCIKRNELQTIYSSIKNFLRLHY